MSHGHPTQKPSPTDLVLVRFAVPSRLATLTPDEVFVRTCTESVIRVPRTLLKPNGSSERASSKKTDKAAHLVFEARVPRDVAAAVRSICSEFVRLMRSESKSRQAA